MLIGPIATMPYNIPVIHLYGGAVTLGAIDELIRHSITKMSHFNFILLPIYKKDNDELLQNYRPISTLAVFSKIFENPLIGRYFMDHPRISLGEIKFSKKIVRLTKNNYFSARSKLEVLR